MGGCADSPQAVGSSGDFWSRGNLCFSVASSNARILGDNGCLDMRVKIDRTLSLVINLMSSGFYFCCLAVGTASFLSFGRSPSSPVRVATQVVQQVTAQLMRRQLLSDHKPEGSHAGTTHLGQHHGKRSPTYRTVRATPSRPPIQQRRS